MPRPKSGNIRINLMIDPTTLAAARALAKRRGETYSEIIRVAIRAYVLAEFKKEKEKENSAQQASQ